MSHNNHAELAVLRARLQRAEETIAAIRSGAVDAFVVNEASGKRVYTLEGADRPYRLLVEEMQQGAATLAADGTIVYCNRRFADLLGQAQTKLTGSPFRPFIAEDDIIAYDQLVLAAVTGYAAGEFTILNRLGKDIPVLITLNALPAECGAALGMLLTNLTLQRHEEEQRQLIDELNHRVRNTLASVQAIAQQTLRSTKDPGAFAAGFMGRIQSMARAHTMLSKETWHGVDLRSLITDQMMAGSYDGARVEVAGTAAFLDPQQAVRLAMVLHELATNACKHGALAGAEGRANISWTIAEKTLTLVWTESESSPLPTAAPHGFGFPFIERSIAAQGGKAQFVGTEDGVAWTITLPLVDPQTPAKRKRAPRNEKREKMTVLQGAISGKRFLIVEDEPLVAMDLAAIVEDANGTILGPACTVADALSIISAQPVT